MIQADAQELLAVARRSLLDKVLPAVNGQVSYEVRMIANAIGIVAREMRDATSCAAQEQALLQELLGGDCQSGSTLEQTTTLCKLIDSGYFDSKEASKRLVQNLYEITLGKLRISNPKVLGKLEINGQTQEGSL